MGWSTARSAPRSAVAASRRAKSCSPRSPKPGACDAVSRADDRPRTGELRLGKAKRNPGGPEEAESPANAGLSVARARYVPMSDVRTVRPTGDPLAGQR